MVVVGSRGMGALGRVVLGSVSSGLVHHAHCPVAVVHADEAQAPDRTSPVLLGIDGSPASEAATALAFDEASRRGVDLVALHAWSDVGVFPVLGMDWQQYEDEGHEVLAERLAGWQEQYPDVHVRRRVVCDQPAPLVASTSPQQAQLVVVGSHGRGGFKGMLLGSVSTAVAEGAKAPVIVVRTPVGIRTMRTAYHEHLSALTKQLAQMCGLAGAAMGRATQALLRGRPRAGRGRDQRPRADRGDEHPRRGERNFAVGSAAAGGG